MNRAKQYYALATDFTAAVSELAPPDRSPEEIMADLHLIKDRLRGNWYAAKKAKDLAGQAVEALEGDYFQRVSYPLKKNLLDLAGEMDQTLAEAKEKRQLLDFDDMLLLTRDLLARNPEVRGAMKKRFRVVLVDEFQDTNRLQADILAYMLEPEGSDTILPPEASALDSLERSARRLIIFGDPKQSIYRFRGAEVSVFQRLKESITSESERGLLVPLDRNFRSRARLVDFFNEFFPTVMPKGREYESEYGPSDHQEKHRPDPDTGPGALVLATPVGDNTAESRDLEARCLADFIRDILDGKHQVRVGAGGESPRPRDVAVLLRRFTHLKVYEQAFRRLDIPYYTVRGQGFYRCQEVRDLISLLFYLAEPGHGPALLGVLRSPLFGVTDAALARLAWPGPGLEPRLPASYFGPDPPPWPDGLPPDQIEALTMARTVLGELAEAAGRRFPWELIETAVEKCDYIAVLLGQYQGRQKVANVKRFIEISREMPCRALYTPGEMARFLKTRLADTRDDPEAQATTEGAGAIQIMTIHQAKGLQFPVVVVPDAGHRGRAFTGPLIFGPGDGFALRFKDPDTRETRRPGDFLDYIKEDDAREKAEHARLLYVAATRAEDFLVFSGIADQDTDKNSWLSWLSGFAAQKPDLLQRIDPDPLEVPNRTASGAMEVEPPDPVPADPGDAARRIVARALDGAVPAPDTVTMNATGLAQYLKCPRQYFLEKVVGLKDIPDFEKPSTRDREPDRANGPAPREKGNLFHYLMETIDLDLDPDLDIMTEMVRQRGPSEGVSLNREQARGIAEPAHELLLGEWGRELIRAHRSGLRVERECPVWLRIAPAEPGEPALVLTGEIDLFHAMPDGRIRLIDYKFASPAGAKGYIPQIRAYALALIRSGLGREIEALLYFAGEKNVPCPVPLPRGWMVEFENRLRQVARDLARHVNPDGEGPPPLDPCPYREKNCPLAFACPD